tara:strand:- start:3237 stop:5330 length:2094 start_codon:yes stop_codon:yes gene_type:complete
MRAINKLAIKDSNYSDYVQNNATSVVAVVNTRQENDTFEEINVVDKKLNITYNSTEFQENQTNGGYLETITLTSLPGGYNNFNEFKTEIDEILDTTHLNHLTSLLVPQRTQLNNNAEFVYSAQSTYNYYAKGYEEQTTAVTEKEIPNYYIESGDANSDLKVFNVSNFNEELFKSVGVDRSLTVPATARVRESNIIFDGVNTILSKVEGFPFFNTIEMSTYAAGDITNFINDSGLFVELTDFYISGNPATTTDFDLLDSKNAVQVQRQVTTEIFSFNDFITDKDYTLGNQEISTVISDTPVPDINDMFGNFSKVLLNGIFRNSVRNNLRTIQEVLENRVCYNEVLFYRVDKYVGSFLGQPVQTFWFANKNEALQYCDTQVKYGTVYAYDVSAYSLVLGNSYSYSDPTYAERDGQFYADLTVNNFCSAQLVRIPLLQFSIASIQNPPLRPHVDFSTKMNAENNIKITLGHNLGEELAAFIPITSQDSQQEALMTLVQYNYSGGENLKYFKSDGTAQYFEVFRTTDPPQQPESFVGNKIADAKQFFSNSRESSSHISINDFVLPNVKYYYMFRAVNVHNHVSNPTTVYELVLTQDADDSKVTVVEYEYPKQIKFNNSKSFNSLLQVQPTLDQTIFMNNQPAIVNADSAKTELNNITLGDAQEQIWGRVFKIRCRSTTTGRKIDFNVRFNLKKVNSQDNFE